MTDNLATTIDDSLLDDLARDARRYRWLRKDLVTGGEPLDEFCDKGMAEDVANAATGWKGAGKG